MASGLNTPGDDGRTPLDLDEIEGLLIPIATQGALHRRMFGQVWTWAGDFRRTDENLGVPWFEISVDVRRLCDDAGARLSGNMDPDRAAVTFGHRLVSIHPFAHGNGRHPRLAANCLAQALGRPAFGWRGDPASLPHDARATYLAALRVADAGDVGPLIAFARG